MSGPFILPVILQIAGVITIIAEVILPSGGILSIVAAGVFGFSLYKAFAISSTAGMIFAVADVIMIPILVLAGLKFIALSPVTLKKTLSREEGVQTQKKQLEELLNAAGTAITDLRPAGVVRIADRRIDAVTQGGYIDKGTPIVVIKVTGNQVIVKADQHITRE